MDRYYFFRKLLDTVGEDFVITDADMNNYSNEIEIHGECPDGKIEIRARLEDRENA